MKVEIETDSIWRFRRDSPEIIHLSRIQKFNENQPRTFDVTGPTSLFAVGKIEAGVFEVFSGNRVISLSNCIYAIWLPPFSILHSRTKAVSQSINITVDLKPSQIFHEKPCLFKLADNEIPEGPAELFKNAKPLETLEDSGPASGYAEKVKAELDRKFTEASTLNEMAKRHGTSTTILGRYFKKTYGISPSSYRSRLRIFQSSHLLLEGKDIEAVSAEVGFGDLSRFYKTFKSITTATPGQYFEK